MLNLDSTSEKIQLSCSAVTAVQVHASWVDYDASTSPATISPGSTNTIVSATGPTDIVPAPASGVKRTIKCLTAHATGGANTVGLIHTDGTTAITMINPALGADEHFSFVEGDGFAVFDSAGARKSSVLSPGRFLKRTVYVTGSGNHTTDPACAKVRLRLQGGGGGGGGTTSSASNAACGGGGGSGAYVEKDFACAGNTAYAYAVGATGTAGSTAGGTGGTGGSTTFTVSGTTVTAAGGVGGVGQAFGTTAAVAAGGNGGAATNGDLGVAGAKGFTGNRQSGTAGWSGAGADAPLGGGGIELYAAGTGSTPTGYGAGGAGGLVLNGSTAVAGGAGASGVLIVDEYA